MAKYKARILIDNVAMEKFFYHTEVVSAANLDEARIKALEVTERLKKEKPARQCYIVGVECCGD